MTDRRKAAIAVLLAVTTVVGTGVAGTATALDAGSTTQQGTLDVTDLTAPAGVQPGANVTVTATVENVGGEATAEMVEYRFDGTVVDRERVTLDPGETSEVAFDLATEGVSPGTYVHGVFTDQNGAVAEISVTESFEVDEFQVAEGVAVGEPLTLTATVTNPGEIDDEQSVEVRFDGRLIDRRSLSLEAGTEDEVTATVDTTGVAPGEHFVSVFTRDSGASTATTLDEPAGPTASVAFDDQTSDGTGVTVANATNSSAPFYAAVWTLTENGTPDTLLGFEQVDDTSASNLTANFTQATINESQTLVAAVHPDADGNASTVDPDTGTILAADTANVTVETEPPAPTPSVVFEDQTSDGASASVASASNASGPFYAAVWTLTENGTPDTLLGFEQVDDTSATNLTVNFSQATIDESQTLVAAVHPDADGNASTVDPDTGTILAADTANVTVETEPPAPTASVVFEDQSSDGTSVNVSSASNASAPFYAAVWTANEDGTPGTLLGFGQVNDTSAENFTVEFNQVAIEESQTLVAAVHADTDGNASTIDPVVEQVIASDTANVTVEAATSLVPPPTWELLGGPTPVSELDVQPLARS